jgi:cytochrome c oxidase assembly factor CtaG
VGAGVALLLVFVPPIVTSAGHDEYAETVQFSLAAFFVPALLVVGGPWSRSRKTPRARGWLPAALQRLGQSRLRHPELRRTLVFLGIDMALVILWRTPGWMDALARHRWLVVPEAASLVVAGVGLWLELVASLPLTPRLPRPWRAVVAAIAMWATWVLAYVVGFSHVSWYPAYHHAGGLSASADQQISTGIMWLAAICVFTPVIFGDLMAWLKNTEDPDAELRRLVQAERRSGVRRYLR